MKLAVAVVLTLPMAAQDSPALTVLGSKAGVVRPATPREFVASVLGGSQSAMSMDIAPYWLAFGHLVDREIYKAKPIVRLLAGIELSLATAPAADASQPAVLAGAASLRIFDAGDPRLDDKLADCLRRAAERALAASAPCREGADCAAENTGRESALKNTCRDEARGRNWNRSSWAAGAAKDSRPGAALAWSSLAYGFEGIPGLESTSQFILQFSRRGRESIGGLQLRTGGADTHIAIEWTGAGGRSQYSLAAERKVGEKVWLEMTVGGESAKRIFALTSLHWALERK
jgi:hypothetical protein